jgi:hypothetical protein
LFFLEILRWLVTEDPTALDAHGSADWDELVLGHLRFPSCLESSGEIGALFGRIHALLSDSGRLVLSDVLYVLAGESLPVVPLALVKPFIVSVSRDPC